MWSNPVEEEAAFFQRLAHEREVALLEVAQAAVDQFARPRRRAGRPVVCLDQRDGQATRHRVERCTRTDDAAADDEEIELSLTHFVEHGFAIARSELS
jgi:hypothetical protein